MFLELIGVIVAVINKLRIAPWAVRSRRVVFHAVPDTDVWASFADQYLMQLEGMGVESGELLRKAIERWWAGDNGEPVKPAMKWSSVAQPETRVIELDVWSSVYSQ